MKQSEFKKRYDPELGRFTRQHIYEEGVIDVFKNIGSKVFGQTLKKAAKTAATKAITSAATKTGEHVGEKAGDQIIEFLSRKKKTQKPKKVLLGTSAEVNCEIPLNRYSFFEELQDRLLPNVRIELQIEMENDKNLIWRVGAADAAGTTYRLIVTRIQLYVPRIIFNSEGQKLYLENYLKPHKWTYLTETTYNQDMRTQRTGNFRLTNGILKPRHVFIFFINNANLDNQLENPFLYNTFSVSTNPRTLDQCYLEVYIYIYIWE